MNLEIIQTKDGSFTLYSGLFDATYHSKHGALAESMHVFIKNGLDFVNKKGLNAINILEVGYGTGFNAILSLIYAVENKVKIKYTGIEKHTVPADVLRNLNYASLFDSKYSRYITELNNSVNDQWISLNEYFEVVKVNSDFDKVDWKEKYDLIYFDAFSPRQVPQMWTLDVFTKLYSVLNDGGALVTFCAQGQFKRDLKSAGFTVQTLVGAPGKREMTRGLK